MKKQRVLPDDTIEVGWHDTEGETCWCSPREEPSAVELLRAYTASIPPPRRHPSSQRFHEILQELGELHDQKSIGYGTDEDPLANVRSSEEWCVPAWTGCMIRAQDKIRRLQAFSQKGELPFEAIEDAFRDLAVYSIIGLILFEEQAV